MQLVLLFICAVFSQSSSPPTSLATYYTTINDTTYIAVNWTQSPTACPNGWQYQHTTFFDILTQATYQRTTTASFFLAYTPQDKCQISLLNASNVCLQTSTNTTLTSPQIQSNPLLIVLPIGTPPDLEYTDGYCLHTEGCGIIFQFPPDNTTCVTCGTYAPLTIEYETNISCQNWTQNASNFGFCNTGDNISEYGMYRLGCSWKTSQGFINITTNWSASFIVDYQWANFTNGTIPTPIPLPLLITIGTVFLITSAVAVAVVLVRHYCPTRAGYFAVN